MLIIPTNSDPSVNKPTTCRLDVQIKKNFYTFAFKRAAASIFAFERRFYGQSCLTKQDVARIKSLANQRKAAASTCMNQPIRKAFPVFFFLFPPRTTFQACVLLPHNISIEKTK